MSSSSSSRASYNTAATRYGRYDESVAKSNTKPSSYNKSTVGVGRTFPSNASNSSSQATGPNYSPGAWPQIERVFYGYQSHASGGNQVLAYSQTCYIDQGFPSNGSVASSSRAATGHGEEDKGPGTWARSLRSGLPTGLHPPSLGQTFPSTPSASSNMSSQDQEQPPRWPYYGYQSPLPPPNVEVQPHWDWRSSQELPSTKVEDQSHWGWRSSHEVPSAKVLNDQPDPLNKGKAHALPPNNDNIPRWGWKK